MLGRHLIVVNLVDVICKKGGVFTGLSVRDGSGSHQGWSNNQIRVMSVAENIKGIRPFTVDSVNPYKGQPHAVEKRRYVLIFFHL
jgi:hypothetical protein